MKDDPHPSLLNRAEVKNQVQNIFAPQIELLEEMVNYGSNLILRSFASSKRTISDGVIIHNFLKQAVTSLDGIQLLAASGSPTNGFILLRSLFEIRIYLEWILRENTHMRGLFYYVWDLRKKRSWHKKMIPGTPENTDYTESLRNEEHFKLENEKYDAAWLHEEISKIDAILARPEYSQINSRFEALPNKYPDWFSPEVGSLKQMAKAIGHEGQYQIFYGHYSKYTHGLAIGSQYVVANEQLHLIGIRAIEEIDHLLQGAYIFAHDVFFLVLQYYRPDEVRIYCRKHIAEWRQRKLSTPIGRHEKDGSIVFTVPSVPPLPPDASDPENIFRL